MENLHTALSKNAYQVAPRLLGCILEREIDGQTIQVKIVEVEAYDQTDAASHSYNGQTPRTNAMFGPAGHLYVYFTYGMHYCCNIVTGARGDGEAVLIRAVEPIVGQEVMEARRNQSGIQVSNGPAKLCQALSIDKRLNGHDLSLIPLKLILQPALSSEYITKTTRIGITKDIHREWRFYITDSPHVSRL